MYRWIIVAMLFGLVPGAPSENDAGLNDSGLIHLVEQAPVRIRKIAPGLFLLDFGRVAFGNLSLTAPDADTVMVRFGEALRNGRVDTHPPGTVRYSEVKVTPKAGEAMIVASRVDARNILPPALLTPAAWGVLTPFRWVEVEGWVGDLGADQIRRRASFDRTWVDDAASFQSSDTMLDKVWDLCHYSIKATTFAGIFVDGDRERIACKADAYLDQLGYYAGDADSRIVRATFDRLMEHPTWPTEWGPHMVFMAYADWMETGDRTWLAAHYESLKTKLLDERVGPDGLVTSSPAQIRRGDNVDWPTPERDGYVFTGVNTVMNAFHLRALQEMAVLAEALHKSREAAEYTEREKKSRAVFQTKLFDPAKGLYRDGVGTDHTSWHANAFPLAFGLVPEGDVPKVAQWLIARGMAGSVYAAQYLLEGLFENGQDAAALRMMTAPGDRSWRHMVDEDATITWEAWDQKYKPNQDWNHAWGAGPANLLPRFVLGVQAVEPGWKRALIEPHPGDLTRAEGRMPTPLGEVTVGWTRGKTFVLRVTMPAGMTAQVSLPAVDGATQVLVNGAKVKARREGGWWTLEKDLSGSATVEER